MIIECKRVKFYTSYDEDAFFEYLAKIKSVIEVKGKKDVIYLTIDYITDDDLCNLAGLFRRYKIKMNALENMLQEAQKKLFDSFENFLTIFKYLLKMFDNICAFWH